MTHTLTFTVTVELSRESGKFAPRDEMETAICDELYSSNPGTLDSLGADGDSVYTVESWEVEPTR